MQLWDYSARKEDSEGRTSNYQIKKKEVHIVWNNVQRIEEVMSQWISKYFSDFEGDLLSELKEFASKLTTKGKSFLPDLHKEGLLKQIQYKVESRYVLQWTLTGTSCAQSS